MPGDNIGYSCSAEIIVASRSPLDPDAVSPKDMADGLKRHLESRPFTAGGSEHEVLEVHIYRVAPTLTAIREKFGVKSPWVKPKPKGAVKKKP